MQRMVSGLCFHFFTDIRGPAHLALRIFYHSQSPVPFFNVLPLTFTQRCKKRQIRQIYLCYFFPAGAMHAKKCWAMHAENNIPTLVLLAPVSTGAVSTISISPYLSSTSASSISGISNSAISTSVWQHQCNQHQCLSAPVLAAPLVSAPVVIAPVHKHQCYQHWC